MQQQHIIDLVEGMLSGGQGPDEEYRLYDTRTNMMIPSDLVTMERAGEKTNKYDLMFATPRIAQVVADVQEKQR